MTENLKTIITSTLYNLPAYQRLDSEKKAKFTIMLEEEIEKCSGRLAMFKILRLPKRMEKRMIKEGLISEEKAEEAFSEARQDLEKEKSGDLG